MIITNAYILHIPMTVLFFGLNHSDARFARPAAIFDQVQSTGFYIQDFIISGIYIYKAARAFKIIITLRSRDGRNAIIHLLYINILVVILNVLLLLTEYKLHYVQVSFKTVVYSIKLKLEFSVLNRLQLLVHTNPYVYQRGPEGQRRPSDRNIFGKVSSRSLAAPDVRVQPSITEEELPRHSLQPGNIHGYHKALRQISSDSIILPEDASYSGTLSEGHSSTPSSSSSETLPRLELTLSQFSPRLDV